MEPRNKNPEELLLDWHLDRLEEDDRSWIEAELHRSEELRQKSDRLGQILRPLDHWTIPEAPPNLADKVLQHVVGAASGGAVSMTPAVEQSSRGGLLRISLRELVAVAACLVLMMGVLFPSLSLIRSRSQRTMCASNLGAIYEGTRLYQSAFGGSLPFAGGPNRSSWLPTGPKDRPYSSNSRHVYLLVKLNYGLRPEQFVCPACKDAEPMKVADPAAFDDFARASHISYDSLNLAGETPNLRPKPSLAYLSDPNPLFISGSFNQSLDPDAANSPAHNHGGQNVGTLDGSVIWSTSPVCGPSRDNLWTVQGIHRYTGIEIQTSEDDAFLIPGQSLTNSATAKN